MKIGILTFNRAVNYGAVLQAFCLQQTLIELGYDVEIIDYRPDYFNGNIPLLRYAVDKSPGKALLKFATILIEKKKYKGFSSFSDHFMKLSNSFYKYDFDFVNINYDVIIVGSDQVWNPVITCGFDNAFWGNTLPEKTKKITYAASIRDFPDNYGNSNFLRNSLKNFDAISIRESSRLNMIESLYYKKVAVVLDPVLLAPSEVWDFIKKRIESKKYLLVYEVRSSSITYKIAKKIALERGLKLVTLSSKINPFEIFSNKQTLSPIDFVNYFKFADYVVTTSFHGTAFSILFNKNFYTASVNTTIDERSSNLLKEIGLFSRLISNLEEAIELDINYEEPIKKMLKIRNLSLNYLLESLK
ncbi:MAG: polysaccharide pyruvyl transferase family protein [Paludibacter sp.]